jgi:hypothetical protein
MTQDTWQDKHTLIAGIKRVAAARRTQVEPRGFLPIEGFSPVYLEVACMDLKGDRIRHQ